MNDGRKRTARVLATLCITALGGSIIVAAPTHAEPDIDSVQSRVDRLYQQAEQASERYNDARLEMRQARTRLRALQSDLRRQQTRVETMREQVAAAVVAQYQGQALSSTTQVLLSDDPASFLDQLTTVSEYNDQQSQMMAGFAVQAKRLEMRQAAARRELTGIAATKQELGTEKSEIDDKAARAKKLLGDLKDRAAARASRARERAAAAAAPAAAPAPNPSAARASEPAGSSDGAAPAAAPASVPASDRAAAAVSYAMAQIGKAYVYGAAGPSAFDCSGLTMMAWAQAGVSLPHSSSAQTGSGAPVSQSQLQPGDLVFYYSPVSHVGMYIGHGEIVNALNPGAGIRISDVNSMPYSGAVRPG